MYACETVVVWPAKSVAVTVKTFEPSGRGAPFATVTVPAARRESERNRPILGAMVGLDRTRRRVR